MEDITGTEAVMGSEFGGYGILMLCGKILGDNWRYVEK